MGLPANQRHCRKLFKVFAKKILLNVSCRHQAGGLREIELGTAGQKEGSLSCGSELVFVWVVSMTQPDRKDWQ